MNISHRMLNKQHIQKKAEELLALPFASGEFPVPVEQIVEHLGFECHLFEPNQETTAISGVVNHKKKKIFINTNDSPQRQLFTLAHEIGHIVLHEDEEDYIDYRSAISSSTLIPKEAEANLFAASLLMPEEIFRFQWRQCGKNLTELAHFFGVSTTAIAVRADTLNLD